MRGLSMQRVVGFVFLVAVMLVSVSGFSQGDAQGISRANNAFAVDMYNQLKSKEGNLFFSPYSISSALAMTYVGARGKTKEEMANVLYFPSDIEAVAGRFSELDKNLSAINKKGEVEITTANSLWLQEGYPILKSFLDITNRYFRAGVNLVDFSKDPESSRQKINRWVEKKTKDRIKNLIQRGIIDPLTCLVLCNAIYFKGQWESAFNKSDTRKMDFWISKEKSIKIDMMQQTEDFRYRDFGAFKGVALPYKGWDISMVIFLPKDRDGLPELENMLNAKDIWRWTRELVSDSNPQQVKIFLPKFKFERGAELSKVLSAMGMPDAFSGRADFSGITGKKDLSISKVIHKAFIEVEEEGTEAAAATAVVLERGLPITFCADHPFIFLIRDNKTGSILFMGRVVNPKA